MNFGSRVKPWIRGSPCPLRHRPNLPLAMYSSFRQFCERLLRIPPDPKPPPGDEASTRLFRAAPAYYKYLLIVWALKSLLALFIVSSAMIGPVIGAFVTAKKGNQSGLLLLLIPGVAFPIVIALR